MDRYMVVVHEAEEGGFWAEVPDLPGCFTQGETLDEVWQNAREAIATYLEALRAKGDAVPGPSAVLALEVQSA